MSRVGAGRGASLALLLGLATLVAGPGGVAAAPAAEGRSGHPRLFFRAEDLEAGRNLRGRVAVTGSHGEEYALLMRWAQGHLGRPASAFLSDPDLAQEAALTYAFLFQLSGRERFARRAVDLTRTLIRSREGRLPGFRWWRLPVTVALVFDWTYDSLSPEDRQALLYDLLKRGIYVRGRKAPPEPRPFDPAAYLKPLLFAVLALEDEPEASRYVPTWKDYVSRLLTDGVLTDLKAAGGQGAWLPVTSPGAPVRGLERERDLLECLEAWRTVTGRLPTEGRPSPGSAPRLPEHFRYLGRRLLYRMRPGLVLAGLGAEEPRAAGVPPDLLYLLSYYEDDPTGRWLAETLRLAQNPEPGSAAWLRDLRSRILWLTKGRRRVSPEEADLPTAAYFADTGEVVVRSSWDLRDPGGLWYALRTSPAGASPVPYWNHLAVVRGRDALVVEANVASTEDSPYREHWFGQAAAQSSVAGSASVDASGFDFALAFWVNGSGFTYARGEVAGPVRPGGRYRFTREVMVFPEGVLVILDRVRGGDSAPVWVLHTLDEPRLLGRGRRVAGVQRGGISESDRARGATWQTGRSRAHLIPVLPRKRKVRTIGGREYGFWVEALGENLWPVKGRLAGRAVPYGAEELRRREVGTWRVEILPTDGPPAPGAGSSPGGGAGDWVFLNVLVVGLAEAPEPQVTPGEQEGALGVRVLRGGRRYEVAFGGDGSASVVVVDGRTGRRLLAGSVPARAEPGQ